MNKPRERDAAQVADPVSRPPRPQPSPTGIGPPGSQPSRVWSPRWSAWLRSASRLLGLVAAWAGGGDGDGDLSSADGSPMRPASARARGSHRR